MKPALGADYNLRILAPIARFFREKGDDAALAAICAEAAIEPADFDKPVRWISHCEFEKILAATRVKLETDEAFMEACAHRMGDAYGPLRFLTWATTPALVYGTAPKFGRFFSTVGKFELTAEGPNFAHLRYSSSKPESRLMCLSRQAQSQKAPSLWGLPPAFCREGKCIARGDDCCEYQFFWFTTRRWLPAILGFWAGLVVLGIASLVVERSLWQWAALLPLFGAAVGHVLELGRTQKANQATQQEITDALRAVVNDDAEARVELLELHRRQRGWTRILEEEAAVQHSALQKVALQFKQIEEARETALRGFSHDLRNPLAVVAANVSFLAQAVEGRGEEETEIVRDLERATDQMTKMISELMQLALSKRGLVQLIPERFEVAPLTDRLRRRLRALVHGRDIRASVFSTREAPEAIQIDPLLFDRVIDNLLTNAAKYTEIGSIVVEIGGTPGFLVLKVSDTGRGIEVDALERIFISGGSDATKRARDSFGVGLSVVVGLLDQIGGRLEVISKVGSGTTFWVCFPTTTERKSLIPRGTDLVSIAKSADSPLSRVVKIRRNTA